MSDLNLQNAITIRVSAIAYIILADAPVSPGPYSATVCVHRVNGIAANRIVTSDGLTSLTLGEGDTMGVVSGAVNIFVPKDGYYLKFHFQAGDLFSACFSPHRAISDPYAYKGTEQVSQIVSGYIAR